MLVRITAPHYCAGLVVQDGVVVESAPILNWTMGKPFREVLIYMRRKGYKVEAKKDERWVTDRPHS